MHEEQAEGTRRHDPYTPTHDNVPYTPTHDNVPYYTVTYAKACTCVPIRRAKRLGCQEICAKTKRRYLTTVEEILVCHGPFVHLDIRLLGPLVGSRSPKYVPPLNYKGMYKPI
jgi:hypothetical protein